MQNTDLQIIVSPKISLLNSDVLFEFIFPNDYNITLIKAMNSKVHLLSYIIIVNS